jgi:hypothetical protein
MQDQLSKALAAVQQHSSLKLWQLGSSSPTFTTPAAFSSYVRQQHIPPELQQLLPDPTAQQAAGEAAAATKFQTRMDMLLERLMARHLQPWNLLSWETGESQKLQEGWSESGLRHQRREAELVLVCDVLDALQQEHQQLLLAVRQPLESFLCECLVGASLCRPCLMVSAYWAKQLQIRLA